MGKGAGRGRIGRRGHPPPDTGKGWGEHLEGQTDNLGGSLPAEEPVRPLTPWARGAMTVGILDAAARSPFVNVDAKCLEQCRARGTHCTREL